MNDKLKERRDKAEEQFKVLAEQKAQKEQEFNKEINEIDTELARLQGEWRLVNDLLTDTKTKNVSKEADKLDIVEGETHANTN